MLCISGDDARCTELAKNMQESRFIKGLGSQLVTAGVMLVGCRLKRHVMMTRWSDGVSSDMRLTNTYGVTPWQAATRSWDAVRQR